MLKCLETRKIWVKWQNMILSTFRKLSDLQILINCPCSIIFPHFAEIKFLGARHDEKNIETIFSHRNLKLVVDAFHWRKDITLKNDRKTQSRAAYRS